MASPTITAEIKDRTVARGAVLEWEDRRITSVARKLGTRVSEGAAVEVRRQELLDAKVALGPDAIALRLRRQTRAAETTARLEAKLSRRRRLSRVDLHIDGGSAGQFVEAFDGWTETSDEAAMLRACPDHYVIRTRDDGRQEVLEATGGSPLPSLFFIDYDDISSLVTPADPQFPHQIAGVARTSDGVAIGGVRHQFRDTPNGFHARLTVEFPLPTFGAMVAGHRWHLACEFSNWIEAAFV